MRWVRVSELLRRAGDRADDVLLPMPLGVLSVNTPSSWKFAKAYACAGKDAGMDCKNVALCTDWTLTKSKIWMSKQGLECRQWS